MNKTIEFNVTQPKVTVDLNNTTAHVECNLAVAGARGKSAYEIAVEHGFIGTEEEWLETLKPEQIEEHATHYNFPNVGERLKMYVATEENRLYRWDSATQKYYCIGSDIHDIKVVEGGNA